MRQFGAAICVVIGVSACSASDNGGLPALPTASLVIQNADIHSLDSADVFSNDTGGRYEALCVAGDTIVYVGEKAGAAACIGQGTRVIDAAGRVMLPGLIDSHSHMFMGSISEQSVNFSLADTPEKLAAALSALKAANPGTEPIVARGWQNHLFPPSGPLATQLDEVFGDRVVIIESVDGHSTWFSSAALKRGGATALTPDPKPGVIFFERDPQTGALLGTAREGAGQFIIEALIKRDKLAFETALKKWLPAAAQSGLTGMYDAGMEAPSETDAYGILTDLDNDGALTLRAFTSTVATELFNATAPVEQDPVARLLDHKNLYTGRLVEPTAVKIYVDGVPEAHTAFLARDYVDLPGDTGAPMLVPAALNAVVLEAQSKGVNVHMHAIGGGAIKMALDAVEAAQATYPNSISRHAVAHMDFTAPSDIERFETLGVIAQTSIQWATRDPSFDNIAKYVGQDVMEQAYPVKSIIEAGVIQSFGADWPAAPYLSTYKPFYLLEIAVTRRLPGDADGAVRNPDQRLSIANAVQAMTRASAYQLGKEGVLGQLSVGAKADFILINQDVFNIPPHEIHKTVSDLTVVDGRVVYDAL